jgi:hypothetical protein
MGELISLSTLMGMFWLHRVSVNVTRVDRGCYNDLNVIEISSGVHFLHYDLVTQSIMLIHSHLWQAFIQDIKHEVQSKA